MSSNPYASQDKDLASSPNAPLAPGAIMALSTAYWGSQTLLTATRLGLFEVIANGAGSVAAISEKLDIKPRPARLFLDACVALGILSSDGERYNNTPFTQMLLVPGSPQYLGNAIRYSDDLYNTWGNLEKALREDKEQLPAENYLGKDVERTRHFVYGMHDRALGVGNAMAGLIDLQGRTQMLDIGGGPGTYSVLFSRRNPGLKSTVLELPPIAEVARHIVEDLGASDKVTFLPGDFHKTDFPTGNDVVLISGVFHRESAENCQSLIQRAVAALNPKGMLVVSDVFTNAGRQGPEFATLFGLNMMLTAPDGCVHADADVAGWMLSAGLTETSIKPFPQPMPHRIVVGCL